MPEGYGALAAAGLAALASLLVVVITKEQKVSEFRQAWIDALRSDISEFLGEIASLQVHLAHHISRGGNASKFHRETAARVTKAATLRSRVHLRLNTSEADHARLADLLLEIQDKYPSNRLVGPGNVLNSAEALSKKILKAEWDRVRQGELTHRAALKTAYAVVCGVGCYVVFAAGLSLYDSVRIQLLAKPPVNLPTSHINVLTKPGKHSGKDQ